MRQSTSFRPAPGGKLAKVTGGTKSGAVIDMKKHALLDGAVIARRSGQSARSATSCRRRSTLLSVLRFHGAASFKVWRRQDFFFARVTAYLENHVVIERLIDGSDRIVAVGRTYGTIRSCGRIFDVPLIPGNSLMDRPSAWRSSSTFRDMQAVLVPLCAFPERIEGCVRVH